MNTHEYPYERVGLAQRILFERVRLEVRVGLRVRVRVRVRV